MRRVQARTRQDNPGGLESPPQSSPAGGEDGLEPRDNSGAEAQLLTLAGFRRLLLAQFTSRLGDWACYVALITGIHRLTGADSAIALVMTARLVPSLVLGPLAGTLADILDRRRLMVAADVARAALFLLLPLCRHGWQFILVVLAAGTVSTCFGPACQALVPRLVPARRLLAANSLLQFAQSVTLVAGPAVGGLICVLWGPEASFCINSATYLISAGLVLAIRLPGTPTPATAPEASAGPDGTVQADRRAPRRAPVGSALLEGFHLLWRERETGRLVAARTLVAVGAGVYNVLYPVMARQAAPPGDQAYGLLLSVWGLGTAAGAVAAARLRQSCGLARLYAVGILWAGVWLGLCADGSRLGPALVCICLGGVGDAVSGVGWITLMQQRVPDRLRGRAFALGTTLAFAGQSAAMLVAGLVGPEALRTPLVVAAAGVYLLAALVVPRTPKTFLEVTPGETIPGSKPMAAGR